MTWLVGVGERGKTCSRHPPETLNLTEIMAVSELTTVSAEKMKFQLYIFGFLRAAELVAAAVAGEGVALEAFFEDLVDNLWHSKATVETGKRWSMLTEDEKFEHFKKTMGIRLDESFESFKRKMALESTHDDLHVPKSRGSSLVSSDLLFFISHIPEEKRTAAQNEWLRLFPAAMFDQKPVWPFKEMEDAQKDFIVDQTLAINFKLSGEGARWEDPLSPAQQGWIMTRPIETLTRREIDWMIEKEGRRAGSLRDFDWTFDEEGHLRPVESRRAYKWLKSFFHINDLEASQVIFESKFASFLRSYYDRIRYSPDSAERTLQLKFIFYYFHDDPSDAVFQELSIQQAGGHVNLLS